MKRLLKVLLLLTLLFLIGCFFLVKPDISVSYLESQYFSEDSKYLEVDDHQVHFRMEGQGKDTLILLHGTGASLHTWDGWSRSLRDSIVIVRLDLPAFGLTGPHIKRDYSMEAYLTFLDSFVNKLGIQSFSLAGNSLGGGIAWYYAYKNPDKIKSLILLNASGYPSKQKIGIFSIAQNPILGPFIKYVTPRSLIEKNLKEVYADDRLVTESLIDRYYHLARRPGNRQAFIDRVNTGPEDHSRFISSLEVPTLIMWGSQDKWNNVEQAHKFGQDLINSTTIVYEHLGHVPMEEDPIQTARDAKKFLSSTWQNIYS